MPKPGSALIPASGILVQDQTWGGSIQVEGDVVVPAGVTLTIAPGAVLGFSQAPAWRCGEKRPQLDPHKCSVVVFGRLRAEGAILLGDGAPWGGLHFLGKGEGRLSGIRLHDSVSHGISLWDEASVDISEAELRRCWAGIGAHGESRLGLRGCLIEGMRESGVIIEGAQARLERLVSRGHAVADVHLRGGKVEIAEGRFSESRSGVIAEEGSLHVSGGAFDGHAAAAFDLRRGEHRLERVKASGPAVGLYVGAARVTALEMELSCGASGAVVSKDGRLDWKGGGWNGGKTGCSILGGQARLEDLAGAGAAQGVRLESGSLAGRGLALKGHRDAGLSLLAEGSAKIEVSRVEDCPAGLVSLGARVELSECVLSGLSDTGIDLEGSGHLIRRTAVSAVGTGLSIGRGAVEVLDFDVSSVGVGVLVGSGGRIDWKRGGWKGGRFGLHILGGEASLEGTEGRDALQGIRLEEGRLDARRSRIGRHRDIGLAGQGAAVLVECVFQDTPVGVLATGGAFALTDSSFLRCASVCCGLEKGTHRLEGCFFDPACKDVLLGPGAEVFRNDGKREGEPRRALWSLVLKTRHAAPLRWLYRAAYAAAVAWVRVWSLSKPEVKTSLIHRGWVTGDWQAGVSDLDFILIVKRATAFWLKTFWRAYERWKRWFPFLGEVLIAEPADVGCYMRHGGLRAGELPAQSRLLAGRPVQALAGRQGSRSTLHECAHAYTRLMQWSFPSGRNPEEFDQAQFLKARVDLFRFTGKPSEAPLTRREMIEAMGDSLRPEGRPSGALCAESLSRYHRMAKAQGASAHPGRAPSGYRWVLPGPESLAGSEEPEPVKLLRNCFGNAMSGVFLDDIYRSYIVLEDSAVEDPALGALMERWFEFRRSKPWNGTLPILLSRRLWEAWRRLPYLESPVRFLEFAAPSSWSSAGAWFGGFRQSGWGDPGTAEPPPDEDVRALVLESAANLRLTWRHLGSPGASLSAVYLLHYLFSRALGLRLLLERRVGASFFDVDGLLRLTRDHFPEEGKALDRLRPQDWLHSPREAFFEHYGFLDERIRGLAG